MLRGSIMEQSNVTLHVNDHQISMNPFVTDTIVNVILGLIKSLKLKEKPERIKIEINLKAD